MKNLSRTQFLHGEWRESDLPQRPPWSVPEGQFVNNCSGLTACGRCVSACPEEILINGRGNLPVVDFSLGACTFCQECVKACPSDLFISTELPAWNIKAGMSPECLAKKNIECRSCSEACENSAIKFSLHVGRVATPKVDVESCTGCGECLSVCPVKAITVSPLEDQVCQM